MNDALNDAATDHDFAPPHSDADIDAFADVVAAFDGPFVPDDMGDAAPHPASGGGPLAGEMGVRGGAAADIDPVVLARCLDEPLNDTGNGQRLLHWFGDDLLHVRAIGWHCYTGKRWESEGGDEIATRLAQTVAARIALEADILAATPSEQAAIDAARDASAKIRALEQVASPTDEQKRDLADLRRVAALGDFARGELSKRQNRRRLFAQSSGNSSRIFGMIGQALPHKTVTSEALDRNELQFNCENGTLIFVERLVDDPDGTEASGFKRRDYRVELRPHDRADLIAKLAPVAYDESATCPRFMDFLDRFQPNVAIRKFLQDYLGYAMTGLTGEQCLAFLHGLGANGKSTLIDIVCRIMGDYALTLSFESLAGENGRRGDQASPDLARLPGARLVRASEPERGVNFKESLLKSLTGGEPMLVRHLHKEFFEFRPKFKLVLSGNHKPEIGGVDHGIWRRMRLVPWLVTIPDDQRRPIEEVLAEFWEERAGILNWLLQGALNYLRDGLVVPAEISEATAEYREEMDPIGGFIADCVDRVAERDGDGPPVVLARVMYKAFEAWCEANSVRPWKEKSFATVMIEKGFVRRRRKSGREYVGVVLHDVPEEGQRPPHPADDPVADQEVP